MKEAQWYGEQKNPHPLEIKPRFLVVQPVFQSLYWVVNTGQSLDKSFLKEKII